MPKKTIQKIVSKNHEVIVQVKANQKTLYKACQEICNSYNPQDKTKEWDMGHGRYEKRYSYVYHNKEILSRYISLSWLNYVSCIVLVRRIRSKKNTQTQCMEQCVEDSYYLSTKTYTADEFSEYIRDHWGIENQLNYVRDESMGEDKSRIRKNADRMVVLKSFALNIMRKNGALNIREELYRNAIDIARLKDYEFL